MQAREKRRFWEISPAPIRQSGLGLFSDSKVFQNFVDAFLHRGLALGAVFGSVAGFEPAKCIFWYRFPTEANPWTDSNRHTLLEAFQKSYPFKIYLQSHRCKCILDRFELPHYSACRNQSESEKDTFSVRIDSNYHIDSKAMQNLNTK